MSEVREMCEVRDVREIPELEKVLNSWKHVMTHSGGKFSKQGEG